MTLTQQRAWKQLLFPGLLFLGILLFILLLFFYYFFKATRYYRQYQSNKFSGESFILADPEIGFVQRPNITMYHLTKPRYTVYTDSIGARAPQPGMQGPSKADILGIGCSYTWGHGVEDEATYLKVLARQKKLAVSNVAVASYGITTSLLSLKKYAFLKPKIVIYGFIEDQLSRSLQPCAPCISPYCRAVAHVDFDAQGKPFIRPPQFFSDQYNSYMREVVFDHSFGIRDIGWAVQRDFLILSRRDKQGLNAIYGHDKPEYRQKALSFLMDQMVDQVRQMDAKLIIVYLPDVSAIKPISSEIKAVFDRHIDHDRVFFVDLTKPFEDYARQHGPESLKAAGVDAHPSEKGHEIIAEQIAPVLDSLLQPSGAGK